MQKKLIHQEINRYVVGLSVRTNNQECFDPNTNKITPLIARYWHENIADRILNRKNPGVTLAVYTDYESDEHGNYTYFFGEEVSTLENCPPELHHCTILSGNYIKFTTPQGKMPDVVIQAWMNIWKMTPNELGRKRRYQTDIEVYDERASDLIAASMDIYIGVIS